MKSVMNHNFAQVPKVKAPRSAFNRSHGYKTTFDAGDLIPFYCDEVLPGDTLNIKANVFARMATPIKPIMDNLSMDTHYFAVPIRLLWSNWEKFNGAQDDPGDSIDFEIPQMTAPSSVGYLNGTLEDYLTLPTQIPDYSHSALFHRAYNLIYNEWFRDQNLQNSVAKNVGDGPDSNGDYTLLKRGKRHDYFTSCLTSPQKGDAVQLPLGTRAPVRGIGKQNQTYVVGAASAYETDGTGSVSYADLQNIDPGGANTNFYVEEDPNNSGFPNIWTDLSVATAATVNQMREAFQIQKLLEKDARGGTRYPEIILAHFNVMSPDARVQRPEFLGASTTPININPIAQNSQSDTTPQGNMSAFGTVSGQMGGFSKSFVEHCIVIGIVSVRADLNYQQGLNKKFTRLTRYDYYWPTLAHLGEQAVLNSEIYTQDPATVDGDGVPINDLVFGYQERYAEMRYFPSQVTGQYRSNFAQSLDLWHLAQDFSSLPTLNATFIVEQPPIARVVAVTSEPEFLFDSYLQINHVRPMPVYSVPGMIDHL